MYTFTKQAFLPEKLPVSLLAATTLCQR